MPPKIKPARKTILAVGAHPDDIEFMMSGTLILLGQAGWELHMMNLCNGSCGTATEDHDSIIARRTEESRQSAKSIGAVFHEEPQVLHYGRAGTGLELKEGMTFTIEPMINAGRRDIRQLADGWTIVTADHSLSAQWEHTILVTEEGFEVLTQSPGTPEPPDFAR